MAIEQPCPKCGLSGKSAYCNAADRPHFVRCTCCGFMAEPATSQEEAVASWNTATVKADFQGQFAIPAY